MILGTSRRPRLPPRSGDKTLFASLLAPRNLTPIFIPHLPHCRLRTTMSDLKSTKCPNKGYNKVLTLDTINPAVVAAQYAVRGELALRANVLSDQLEKGQSNLPFKNV